MKLLKHEIRTYATILEPPRPHPDRGHEEGRPHGNGNNKHLRQSDAFRHEQGIPLLTTKKLHLKSIIYELLWFLQGDTNVKYLQDHGVRIWNEWADENGELGPIYGHQWRSWPGHNGEPIDQIKKVVEQIKTLLTPDG